MDTLEEGELSNSPTSDNGMGNPEPRTSSAYSMIERKNVAGQSSAFVDRHASSTAYRSNRAGGDSSSDSNSEVDEESPLWKHKKQKYLRQNTDRPMDMRASPTLPEYTNNRRPNSMNTSDNASKKKNDIWGSVLEEQTLTQSLSKSVGVENRNYIDFDCRTVESYDYRKKYKDSRPQRTEDVEIPKPSPTDMFDKDSGGISGRSIIDYEDTVDSTSFKNRKNQGKKRKFSPEPERKKSGIFNRLGTKKAMTVSVGEIDVSQDMEKDELVAKIADFLHEPKVELIERVAESMGKEVAIRIVKMTRDVEHAGGMYTFDGTRKRTPGGVFIQLTKQQPEFTPEVKKIVFKEDQDRMAAEKKERRKRKSRNKKKKTNQGQGERAMSRSNPNSRSVSPSSNKTRSNESLHDESESDDEKPDRNKKEGFDFEAELAAARKQISKAKDKSQGVEEMDDGTAGDVDKENIHEDDLNDLNEDIVDVLVEDADID